MDYVFDDYFNACLVEAAELRYDTNLETRLGAYVRRMAEAKAKEIHHQKDGYNEEKRIMTGLLGELALEHILGIKIIDWSIGKSKDYHTPDIPGYKVGIKTVEYGKFPIIFKKNYYPQIICVVKKDNKAVYICGLGEVDVLNKYQDDDLVLSPNLRARGTKTGFYGLDKLKPVHSIDDISIYKK